MNKIFFFIKSPEFYNTTNLSSHTYFLFMLRTYIKLLLEDAMKPTASNLALCIYHKEYYLYDVNRMNAAINAIAERMKDKKFDYSNRIAFQEEIEAENIMLAQITVKKNLGLYYNAAIVKTAAAVKGYGPLLYDIVMSQEGGLTPDRNEVSGVARVVWNYYFTKRSDVTHKLIDDVEEPETVPTLDDGDVYRNQNKIDTSNPLNYVYFLANGPDIQPLVARHSECVQRVLGVPNLEVSEIGFNRLIRSVAIDFFDNKYSGPTGSKR